MQTPARGVGARGRWARGRVFGAQRETWERWAGREMERSKLVCEWTVLMRGYRCLLRIAFAARATQGLCCVVPICGGRRFVLARV